VTQIVCPFGCVCHAVRAPGVKWTLLALSREPSDGEATVSTNTAPVNQSAGPAIVSMLFRVIFMIGDAKARRCETYRRESGDTWTAGL
jgi:predicted nucleotide-binding protein (sugar kinase/HSP70/actin superfamily)